MDLRLNNDTLIYTQMEALYAFGVGYVAYGAKYPTVYLVC